MLKKYFSLGLFVLIFSLFFIPTVLYAQSATPWSFYNNPSQSNAMDIFYNGVGSQNPSLRITPAGNVGIGLGTSTAPVSRLTVRSADDTSSTNIFQTLANNSSIGIALGYDNIRMGGTATNSPLTINAKGTGNLLLQSVATGNVGIGNLSPAARLDVVANSVNGINAASLNNYGIQVTSTNTTAIMATNANGQPTGSFNNTGNPGNTALYANSTNNYGGYFYSQNSIPIYATKNTGGSWLAQLNRTATTSLSGGGLLYLTNSSPGSDSSGYFIYAISGLAGTPDGEFQVNGAGAIIADGSLTGPADYAEYFETDDLTLDKTEVVCIDRNAKSKISRCSSPHDSQILGVVSTNPGVVGALADDVSVAAEARKNDPHWKIIALLGQVPTQVSTENGVILPGDYLTSSSTPGVAMKATKSGPVFGRALSGYDGTGKNVINGLIQATWYGGNTQSDIDSLKEELARIKQQIELK